MAVEGQEAQPARLLDLPMHLQQSIIILAGRGAGGAVRACSVLRDAWLAAVSCAPLAAKFLISVHGAKVAAGLAYGGVQLARVALERPQEVRHEAPHGSASSAGDASQLELLQVLAAQGAALDIHAGDLVLNAAGAGHLRTLTWLLAPRPAGAGLASRATMTDPLDRAARAGPPAEPIVQALLAAGANPKANESRSLQLACETAVKQAPKRGAGGAPEAGAGDRLSVVRRLLEAGADPRAHGSIGLTLAARARDLELARLLLAAGANPSAANGRALTAAAGAVDEAMVEALLQPGWEDVPVDFRGDALRAACQTGDLAADMAAVESAKAGTAAVAGGDSGQASEPASSGNEPGQARLVRRLAVVRRLLAVGSAPVGAASQALEAAAETGCEELLHMMLNAGASANSNYGYALRMASRRGDTAVAEALLAAGADAAAFNSDALKVAAEGGHDAIVRLLMKHGADPRDNFHAPFLAAVRSGSTEVVEAMLTAGADPRLHNNLAIQVACRMGLDAMARVLLRHGADPTVNGSAAFLDACKAGHEGVVRLLLEDGRVDVRARNGWALQAAEFEGWGGIQKLLREAMRDKT